MNGSACLEHCDFCAANCFKLFAHDGLHLCYFHRCVNPQAGEPRYYKGAYRVIVTLKSKMNYSCKATERILIGRIWTRDLQGKTTEIKKFCIEPGEVFVTTPRLLWRHRRGKV